MTKRLFVLLAFALAVIGASAQNMNLNAPIPADPAVRKGVLENGLTYYIRYNAKPEKQGEFYLVHNVGAIQEEDHQDGLAHFLEHMAFNGTKNFPDKGIIDYLETIGVKFGVNLNARTGREQTIYNISSVPTTREGIIDSIILILHDWSYLYCVDPEEIDKERGVIIEELRTRNTADFRMLNIISPVLFNETRYAYRNVIGTEETLRNFTHDQLGEFYHKWYRTDLQAVVIVGDFDVDAMEATVRRVMGSIPAVENPTPKEVIPIPGNEKPLIAIGSDPEATNSVVSINIKREPLPRNFRDMAITRKMDHIMTLITDIANERARDIILKPDSPFVNGGFVQSALTSTSDIFVAQAIAREGEIPKAFEALYTEIERIRRHGFTNSEFERAQNNALRKAQQVYDMSGDMRSSQFVMPLVSNYLENSAIPSPEMAWQLDSMLIASTSLMEINAIAQQMLITRENQVFIIQSPEKAGLDIPAPEEILAIAQQVIESSIEAPEDNTVNEPLINETLTGSRIVNTSTDETFDALIVTLENGVKVALKTTDFRADEVLFRASAYGGLSLLSDADYPSGELLSTIVGLSGVGKFSLADLQKQLSGKAVSLSPFLDYYENGFSGSCSSKDLETMLQLLYLYATSPRFDINDYETTMNRLLSQIQGIERDPNYISQIRLVQAIFGNNPRRQQATSEYLEKVSFERMAPIYDILYSNISDFTFTLVGSFDLDTTLPLIEKYLGSLPRAKATPNYRDDGVRSVTGLVIDRFETPMVIPKSRVFSLYTGDMDYNLENTLTLSIIKQILDIRTAESIREEKGGTYGVSVMASLSLISSPKYLLRIGFDTDPALVDELIEILEKEIDILAKDGARTDDLAKSMEYMVKQRQDDIKRNGTWLGYLDSWYLRGIDMISQYDETLEGITSEKVKAMVSKILEDNNLLKVIMMPQTDD